MPGIRVEALLEARDAGLALELVAGKGGLGRRISGPRIQKPGLALTGYTAYVHSERLQVLGLTEISYLRSVAPELRRAGIDALCTLEPSAVVVTRGLEVPPALVLAAGKHNIPVFSTPATQLGVV